MNCFRCHCFDMEISLTKTQLCKLKLLLCAHKRVWLCMARRLVWAPKGMSRSLSSRLKESLPTPSISLLWTGRGLPRRKYVLLVSNSGATGDDKFCLVHFSTVSLVLISFSICCSYGVLARKHGTERGSKVTVCSNAAYLPVIRLLRYSNYPQALEGHDALALPALVADRFGCPYHQVMLGTVPVRHLYIGAVGRCPCTYTCLDDCCSMTSIVQENRQMLPVTVIIGCINGSVVLNMSFPVFSYLCAEGHLGDEWTLTALAVGAQVDIVVIAPGQVQLYSKGPCCAPPQKRSTSDKRNFPSFAIFPHKYGRQQYDLPAEAFLPA